MFMRAAAGALLLAVALLGPALPAPAFAAQSYDNCTGYIDSLPATITKQGTWCLHHDLATSISGGVAIAIGANNVTIDCNDFKIGGTAAGLGTGTDGIAAHDKLNVTVRHCNIRGFYAGIDFEGASDGSVIEDNRFDGNTVAGIYVFGDNMTVRRNIINDTGGSSDGVSAYGIYADGTADIIDNTISGVVPQASGSEDAIGILTGSNVGGSIAGNRVRGIVAATHGIAYGIYNSAATQLAVTDNVLAGLGAGVGVFCSGDDSRALRNMINGFGTALAFCRDDGNSL